MKSGNILILSIGVDTKIILDCLSNLLIYMNYILVGQLDDLKLDVFPHQFEWNSFTKSGLSPAWILGQLDCFSTSRLNVFPHWLWIV